MADALQADGVLGGKAVALDVAGDVQAGDALFHTGLADGGKLRIGLRRATGRAGDVLCPMIYPAFPAGWHIPLHLSLPDTRLLTLRDDPRPEICTLRKVFAEVYAEREKLIKAL